MSRKAYVIPKKRVGEIFQFLHRLISLGHKRKEHPSEKSGNFVLVAPMLRDSVYYGRVQQEYNTCPVGPYAGPYDQNKKLKLSNGAKHYSNHETNVFG